MIACNDSTDPDKKKSEIYKSAGHADQTKNKRAAVARYIQVGTVPSKDHCKQKFAC